MSPTPISSATLRMTSSLGVIVGLVTTPSIRLAWSKYGASSARQSVIELHDGSA